jgi:hypothetical protein
VARQMNARKLSAVMAVMTPDRAATLTAALAGDQGPRHVVVRHDAAPSVAGPDQPRIEDLPKIMPAQPTPKPAG